MFAGRVPIVARRNRQGEGGKGDEREPHQLIFLCLERLYRHEKNPIGVMLSAAKHLAFFIAYEDEILRLSPQDDIMAQSPTREML
jgi:hypothetical protein